MKHIRPSHYLTCFKLNPTLALLLCMGSAQAVEFNASVLSAEDKDNIDLSKFNGDGDYLLPGQYFVDVFVNDKPLPDKQNIIFFEDLGQINPCLGAGQISLFGMKEQANAELPWRTDNQCLDLSVVKDITVFYDSSRLRLDVSIPQAWLEVNDPNWVPPNLWDDGIAGVILDYSIFYQHDKNYESKQTSNSINAYGLAGVNAGAWRLRGLYNYNYDSGVNSTPTKLTWSDVYAYRPLRSLRSKLTIGKTYINSQIFDSVSFKGINVMSDERMLPPSLQGYAPQVTGVAKTRALVTLSQGGRVLRQETVAPGPFNISNIPNALRGMIDVRVEEEDGSVNTFQVATANVPFLTRAGSVRYSASLGKTHSRQGYDTNFTSLEGSWGAFNNTSLYGGVIATTGDYFAVAAGVGQNLQAFGGVSFDVTHSSAKVSSSKKFTGNSYRVNYSKNFESTRSQISFAGYRFSDRNFMSLGNYLAAKDNSVAISRPKQTYSLNFNQYVPFLSTTLYASMTKQSYWDEASSKNISLSATRAFNFGRIRNVSMSLTLSQTQSNISEKNTQVSLYMSVPIDTKSFVRYDFYRSRRNEENHSVTYNHRIDASKSMSISAGGNRSDLPSKTQFRANYSQSLPVGNLALSSSYKPRAYRNVGVDWSGSITATRYGVAVHPYTSGEEPRLMVDTQGVKNVKFEGEASSNRFGIAVVNGVQSYRLTSVYVDFNKLSDDIEVKDTVLTQTLTEGAIGYKKINAKKGISSIATITLGDGSYPPLGATLYDKDTGAEVALVSDKGLAYLYAIEPNSTLVLKYGNKSCEFSLPSEVELTSSIRQFFTCS